MERKLTKKAKLWILLPLVILGTSGSVVGGMAIAGFVFKVGPFAARISLETILKTCSSWTTTAPSPIVDSSSFPTNGALVDDAKIYQEKPNENDVKTFLLNQIKGSETYSKDIDLINEITITSIGNENGTGYYHVIVTIKNSSRLYTGSSYLYFHWNPTGTANLADDFSNTNITYTTSSSPIIDKQSICEYDLFAQSGALKLQNPNLQVNAIKMQYLGSDDAYHDWDWTATPNFGATAAGFDENYLTMLWDSTNSVYTNIRISPDPANRYYQGSNPINFTLKLYRPEISSETNWSTNKTVMQTLTSNYNVLPTHQEIIQSTFDDCFSKESWYQNKLNKIYGDVWNFALNPNGYTGNANPVAILNIKGNPYYNDHIDLVGSSTSTDYQWSYGIKQKIKLSDVIVDSNNETITSLGRCFYMDPTPASVQDDTIMALSKINSKLDWGGDVLWNQIDIAIDHVAKTIALIPVYESLVYTENISITYQLITS